MKREERVDSFGIRRWVHESDVSPRLQRRHKTVPRAQQIRRYSRDQAPTPSRRRAA
jgi:hypothetical protein